MGCLPSTNVKFSLANSHSALWRTILTFTIGKWRYMKQPEATTCSPLRTSGRLLSPCLPTAQRCFRFFSRGSLSNYEEMFGTSYVLLLHSLICLFFAPHYVVRFCVFKLHCCFHCMKLSSLNEEHWVLNIAWNLRKIGHLKNTFYITSFLHN